MRFIDLTNKQFGDLFVLALYGKRNGQKTKWECKCSCGNTIIRTTGYLKSKTIISKSCGCKAHSGNITHNMTNSRLYYIWRGIINRCFVKSSISYKNYGKKGILMCDEWRNSFETFYNWAIDNGYNENAVYGECTIDRIDNNGNYEPNNCRWTTSKEQSNNRTNNVIITIGNEQGNIAYWSEKTKIPYSCLYSRYKKGYNNEMLLYLGNLKKSNFYVNCNLQTFNGVTKTVTEWAKEYNINRNLIYDKLSKDIKIEDILKGE